MIDSGMDLDVALISVDAGFLLVLPPQVLLVVGEGHIEVKRLVALVEPQADEGVLALAVLDLEHEVAGRIEHGLDGVLALPEADEASSEELPGAGVLQPDLAAVSARDHPEAAGPDLVGLQPLAALVAAARATRRDLVHRHLPHHQQRVLERLLLLDHRR